MSNQELLELQNRIIEQQNALIRRLIEEMNHYGNFIISDIARESADEIDSLLSELERG